jgi:hypothetical protein
LKITVDAGQTKVYGENDPALTCTPAGLVGTDVIAGMLARSVGEDVGTYPIGQGSLDAGPNYTISFIGEDFEITPAELKITVDAGQTKVYGENDPATFTYIPSGLVGSDTITGILVRATGNNVGTYAIGQGTLSAGDNYVIALVPANFTITPAPLAIAVDAGQTKVYGDSDPAFTCTPSGLVGSDAITGILVRVAGEDVGVYQIGQGSLDAGTNYTTTFIPANFTITPAPLTVTADAGQTKVYGDSDPVFTYTLVGLVGTDVILGSLARAVGEDVGVYPIDQGSLDAGTNYTTTFIPANFTITPAPLMITVDAGQTKVYGDSDPVFTYTPVGLVGTDVIAGMLARGPGDIVGVYAIAQGSLSAGSNYLVTFIPAIFTITPAELTVTVDAGQTKVYGETDPAFTYDITGWQGTDTIVLRTGVLSREPGNNAGTYAITIGNLSAGPNYTMDLQPAIFTITATTLTVTADAGQTKVYGDSDPVFTYTLVGLIGTDAITGALSRAPGESVGTYAITQGTISAGNNYTITFEPANFAITPAELTVAATAGQLKQAGQSDPVFTFSVTGWKGTDSISLITGALSRDAGESAGTAYAINQGTLSAGPNYTITFVPANFAITTEPLYNVKVKAETGTQAIYSKGGTAGVSFITGPSGEHVIPGLQSGTVLTITTEPKAGYTTKWVYVLNGTETTVNGETFQTTVTGNMDVTLSFVSESGGGGGGGGSNMMLIVAIIAIIAVIAAVALLAYKKGWLGEILKKKKD